MSKKYRIVPTDSDAPAVSPPAWSTGLCACAGENACCTECCLVAVGLDFLLYKDTDEWYTERRRGVKYSSTSTYVPDPLTAESFIGGNLYRCMGVLCTCGLAAATGGVFDLLWCYGLARQRRLVRELYHIESDSSSDFLAACCCRCCMFNQLKHQLTLDNPSPPSITPELMNSMRADKDSYRNKTWTVSNKAFKNPPNGPAPGAPTSEYV